MKHLIANLWFYTICRWFGHSNDLVFKPFFIPWPIDRMTYWTNTPPNPVWSGQCPRCWRVVKTCDFVTMKARTLL